MAHYLAYCDVCVTEYWRAIGMIYPGAFLAIGADLFVRKATLEYHAPAAYDDELGDLRTNRTSRHDEPDFQGRDVPRADSADRALVEGELVYVCTDPVSKSPQRAAGAAARARAGLRDDRSAPRQQRHAAG